MNSKKGHKSESEKEEPLETIPENKTDPTPKKDQSIEGIPEPKADSKPKSTSETPSELNTLTDQLSEALAQAAEYKDGWQRSVAEFQNFRKRIERENGEVYQNAVMRLIKRYLPVLDDLERALAMRPPEQAWADGIELIHQK